jgi:hypothetical protein
MIRTPVAPPSLGTLLGNAVFGALVAMFAPAYAQEQEDAKPADDQLAAVEVTGMKNPELQRYRSMTGGLDAFDEYRSLAPNATLKARLSRRADAWGEPGSVEGVSLRLVGNETSTPIPIAADGTFILPRSQAAYDDDADLVLNQKKATIRWYPDVRTPGVPANARRLGDLRMECEVLIGVAKKELNFAQRAAVNALVMGTDWCASSRVTTATPLGDYAISAAVVYGGKRKPIPTRGYRLEAPLRDKSLPDDALIEFEFWSQASLDRKQQFLARWPIQLESSVKQQFLARWPNQLESPVNKWGPGLQLKARQDGRLGAVMPLKPGKWKFRLRSSDGEIEFGARAADAPAVPGVELPLKWQGAALALNVEQAGSWEFLLDVRDPDRPVVTVKPVDPASSSEVRDGS